MWPNGKGQMLVSTQKEPPSYERLLSLLRKVPGSKSARSWVERVLRPDWITGDGGLAQAPAASSPGQPAPSTQAGTALCTLPLEALSLVARCRGDQTRRRLCLNGMVSGCVDACIK